MIYLVLYRGEYLASSECESLAEAEELIKNLLESHNITIDDIWVYKAEQKSFGVRIEG